MLTPKQQRFVDEYLIDLNGAAAARRAGYSERTARQVAAENLTKPVIMAAITEAQQKLSQRTELTQDWVLTQLRTEARESGEGSSHGARVRALELLGKHLGMFPTKIEVESKGTLRVKKVIVHAAERNGTGSNGSTPRDAGGVLR